MPDNQFLTTLPEDDQLFLRDYLEPVKLETGTSLGVINKALKYVYFPQGGLCSVVVAAKSGISVEAGMVGVDGVTGAHDVIGSGLSQCTLVVQVAGPMLRLAADRFRERFDESRTFRDHVLSFNQLMVAQVSQTALCNRLHSIDARLARWLLMSADAVGSEEIRTTQEYLATMLGVQRPGVTLAAQLLQETGSITYSRGRIQITDRAKLESMACDCYETVRVLSRQYLAGGERGRTETTRTSY